jgi:phospholipase/carboxylesterase
VDLLPLADALDPRLFVVAVRAPLPLAQGFEWYRLLEIGRAEPTSFTAGFDALQRFIGDLPRAYPIDPSRIFTLGFSQGSVMAGSTLLARPDAVTGTIMLSGYLPLSQGLPIDESRLAGRTVFVGHGTADPLIPVQWGRQVRDFFSRVGANLTYREYPIAHYIEANELEDVAGWLGARVGGETRDQG